MYTFQSQTNFDDASLLSCFIIIELYRITYLTQKVAMSLKADSK